MTSDVHDQVVASFSQAVAFVLGEQYASKTRVHVLKECDRVQSLVGNKGDSLQPRQ
jgi:hypothetical protein